ncbi:unnamed protein product [Caenorhabditis sp. 36 PRJEB53466]|nr:unnamed protein product [Caenorhabditis sp. 36 PRJEB53466]
MASPSLKRSSSSSSIASDFEILNLSDTEPEQGTAEDVFVEVPIKLALTGEWKLISMEDKDKMNSMVKLLCKELQRPLQHFQFLGNVMKRSVPKDGRLTESLYSTLDKKVEQGAFTYSMFIEDNRLISEKVCSPTGQLAVRTKIFVVEGLLYNETSFSGRTFTTVFEKMPEDKRIQSTIVGEWKMVSASPNFERWHEERGETSDDIQLHKFGALCYETDGADTFTNYYRTDGEILDMDTEVLHKEELIEGLLWCTRVDRNRLIAVGMDEKTRQQKHCIERFIVDGQLHIVETGENEDMVSTVYKRV